MPFTAGLPETGCGAGSTVAHTTNVRAWLPGLLRRELQVKRLLDAPCGDFNWMARTDLYGIDYIGCDYDEEHCLATMTRDSEPIEYRPRSKSVVTLDVCRDSLPDADLMLCRDFLQHLPNALVCATMKNFKASAIQWLLATSHSNAKNTDIAKPAMFRPLNLTLAPFNLPTPRKWIGDGAGRILGLWHRNEITC